jgi:hypothetical protein
LNHVKSIDLIRKFYGFEVPVSGWIIIGIPPFSEPIITSLELLD